MRNIHKVRLPDGSLIDYDETPRPLLDGHTHAEAMKANFENAEQWHPLSPHCERRVIVDHGKALEAIRAYGPVGQEILRTAPPHQISIQRFLFENCFAIAVFHPIFDDDPDCLESGWSLYEFRWTDEIGRMDAAATMTMTVATAVACETQ